MKKLLGIVVLGLLWCNISLTDDIGDFQIEGISVGDSLLDYLSIAQIEQEEQNGYLYKDKKFIIIDNPSNLNVYELNGIVYKYKPRDKKYIIYAVDGILKFPNNIKGCKKELKEFESELDITFKDARKKRTKRNLKYATGKIKTYGAIYYLKSGGYLDLYCEDFHKKGWKNQLVVLLASQEYSEYLKTREK